MLYDKDDFEKKLLEWEKKLEAHRLPTWEELPLFELYMDQVIVLVNGYLKILEGDDERVLTPSMINNYVKLKSLPAPVKKRYSRVHLAYLIMICVLKQSLSMSMIQKVLPIDDLGDSISEIYNAFVEIQNKVFNQVTEGVRTRYKNEEFSDRLFMEYAVNANVYNIIAENLGK